MYPQHMDEKKRLQRVEAARIVLERAKEQYLEELSTAHSEGISYRKLAKVVGTDAPAIMRYIKRNA